MPQRILARTYRYNQRLLYGAAITLSIAILGAAALATVAVVDQYRDKQVALFVTKREQVKSEVDNLSVRLMQLVDLYEAAWSLHQTDYVPLHAYQGRLKEGMDVTGTSADLTVTPFTIVSNLSSPGDADRLAVLLRILRDVSAAPSIDARKIGVTLQGGIYAPDGKFMAFSPPLDERAQVTARTQGAVRFNLGRMAFAEDVLACQSPRGLRTRRPFWVTERTGRDDDGGGADVASETHGTNQSAISQIVLPIFHGDERVLTIDVSVGFDDFLQFFLHSERTPGFFVLDSARHQNLGFALDSAADERRYRAIQRQPAIIGQADGELRSYREGAVFYITQKVNGPDWIAVYVFDWRDVIASLHREALGALGIVLGSLLFLWGAVIYFDKRIAGPLSVSIQKRIEAEHFSKSVVDTIPVGVAVYIPGTHEVVLENAVAARMLGVEAGTNGSDFYKRIADEQPLLHDSHRDHIFREVTWPFASERSACIGVAASSTTYGGRAALLFGLVDLNFKKANERLLIEGKEKADEANRAKSMFLALMTHEIRTPLHGAAGHLELLEREVFDVEQVERVAMIRRSFSSLLKIVDDLLDLTKVESNALTIGSVRMCVNDIVEQCVQQFAPTITQRGVRCVCTTDARLDGMVLGDDQRLGQILLNLLSNAAKFTEKGAVSVRSELISTSQTQQCVRLEVADTGIGIPAALQSTLFNPLTQADDTISRRFGGTGLGLFLCRKLAMLMGGRITLESAPGAGSTFYVDLPFQMGRVDALEEAADACAGLPGTRVGTDVDDPAWRSALAQRITRWGGHFVDAAEQAPLDILVTVSDIGPPNERVVHATASHSRSSARPSARATRTVRLAADLPSVPRFEDDTVLLTSLSRQALRDTLHRIACGEGSAPVVSAPASPSRKVADLDILIAEDEPVSRSLLVDQLRRLGYTRIRSAENGLAALASWRERPADLVITDLSMPVLDGPGLLLEIRREDAGAKVVFTTASVRDDRGMALSAFDGQLEKPVLLDDLSRLLERLTGRDAGEGEAAAPSRRTGIDAILWDAFRVEWKKDRANLAGAVRTRDFSSIERQIHRVRGALLTLGDDSLIQALEPVSAAVGRQDEAELDQAWITLAARVDEALPTSV
ncbi:ATP-binding protein [Robbsia sp. Bb-Pol-6]|uniref:histidine kinase n=1 Tax=Robbsia betulipollinis TaxID=2981849 RepID=A0ABT3ZLB3_9BURK|nr:ATP-binding protein [Robbsia betulipollinis]MCY0387202.1 ATP-binding protein [Robbsia betulipollinis]